MLLLLSDPTAFAEKKLDHRDTSRLGSNKDVENQTQFPLDGGSNPTPFKLGDHGPGGGIVLYVDESGQHGLEAQVKDAMEAGLTSHTTYPDGSIVHFYTWAESKAIASHYGAGWRLPTMDELDLLYQNKDVVGNFGGDVYWSSAEYDLFAWFKNFRNGADFFTLKANSNLVRAVRDF